MENSKKLGRPRTAHWRYKENGKYYDSFKDKEQYLEYHKIIGENIVEFLGLVSIVIKHYKYQTIKKDIGILKVV